MAECNDCGYNYTITDCYCRQCGTEHPDNDEVRIFSCDCGAQVFPEDNFCHACGDGFEGMEEVEDTDDDDDEFDDSEDDDDDDSGDDNDDDDSEDDWDDEDTEEESSQQTLGF